jgi:hypothetical protein
MISNITVRQRLQSLTYLGIPRATLYDVGMKTDPEVEELNRIYQPSWHVSRWPNGLLCASREPGRGYHVLDDSAYELSVSLRMIAAKGSLFR